MFNTTAAAERFPYSFDEMNEQLLCNLARGSAQGAPHPEDRIDSSEIKPDISHIAAPTEEQNEVLHTKSESPILIRGESTEVEDEAEAEDNTNPDEPVQLSANPENADTESGGNQSPEGSPVEGLVENPDQGAEEEEQQESPNNAETVSNSDISQTGSGISINSRLRAHAFSKHLADYEFLPVHDCSNRNEFF